MTEPMLNSLGKNWEKMVLTKFNELPEKEKKQISDEVQKLVRKLKAKHRKNYPRDPRNPQVHSSPPMSTENLLVGIITAMYYEKFGESPAETALKTLNEY